MYKLVETQEDRALFNTLYKDAFKEKNYETEDYYTGTSRCYLISNNEGKYTGTLQFVRFSPESQSTTLDYPNLFLNFDIVKKTPKEKIWEVDKVTVHKVGRKTGTLDNIVKAIYEISKEYDIDYLIAEMNPVFHRALKMIYGISVIKASKTIKSKNNAYSITPTIIPIEIGRKEIEEKLLKNELSIGEI